MSAGSSNKKSSSEFEKKQTVSGTQTKTSRNVNEKIIDAQTEANLRAGQSSALSSAQYFTPYQAKADSKIAVDEAIRGVMQQYLPELNQQVAGSGMYGSTTSRQMQENLATRAGATAALTGLETMKEYSSLSQQAAQTIAQLAGQMGSKQVQTQTDTIRERKRLSESGSGTAKSSGTEIGLSF